MQRRDFALLVSAALGSTVLKASPVVDIPADTTSSRASHTAYQYHPCCPRQIPNVWPPVVKWSPALAMMSSLKVAKFGLVPCGSNCLEAE
jgi:hypothetical protein